MKLDELGLRATVQAAWTAVDPAHALTLARLGRVDGLTVDAWTADGPVRVAVTKKLRRAPQAPVVGDWALLDLSAEPPRLSRLLPRRSQIQRRAAGRKVAKQVLAANVDVAFIVVAMDDDFSERRLERYATLVHESGARPVVVLTKAGLTDARDDFVARASAAVPGVQVVVTDVLAGIDPDAASRCLTRGDTAVLLGSSGVGKSTLVNHLLGRTAMTTGPADTVAQMAATGPVRESDGLGQHTTSHRELFSVPTGGIVIDTPGLREVALWVDPTAVDETFADIDALAVRCRFTDCTHGAEPECAIRAALDAGDLDPARLDSYRSLRAEAERTAAQAPEHERRKAARKLGKLYKQIQSAKRHRR